MSKVGKVIGVVGGLVGSSATILSGVYIADNPGLIKDYIKGNPTYTNQQVEDLKQDYNDKIDVIENENSREYARLNALIEDNRLLISELQALKIENESKIAELNNSISLANSQIETLGAENLAKTEMIESLNTSIEANNEVINSLQQTNNEQVAQITSLQEDNNSKLAQINTLNATIESNNARIIELEQSESSKVEEILQLQADNELKASEITTLNSSIAENNTQISELQESVNSKNETITQLVEENESQALLIEELQAEKLAIEAIVLDLQNQNENLQTQVATLNETITSNSATITELTNQITEYENLVSNYAIVNYYSLKYKKAEAYLEEKGTTIDLNKFPAGFGDVIYFDEAKTDPVPADYVFDGNITLYLDMVIPLTTVHLEYFPEDINTAVSDGKSVILLANLVKRVWGGNTLRYYKVKDKLYHFGTKSGNGYQNFALTNVKFKTLDGEEIDFIPETPGQYTGGVEWRQAGPVNMKSADGLYILQVISYTIDSDNSGLCVYVTDVATGENLSNVYLSSCDLILSKASNYV